MPDILALQRAAGNRAVGALLRARRSRARVITLQRRFAVGVSGWAQADGSLWALTDVKHTLTGIELTFTSASGPTQTIVVAESYGARVFAGADHTGVHYVNPSNTSDTMDVQDLSLFTGAPAPAAGSQFGQLPTADVSPPHHTTDFAVRVAVVPVTDRADEIYTPDELLARRVKVANDRPPTKYGSEGQRSHTVAWSLLRAALERLGDQRLDEVIRIVTAWIGHLSVPQGLPEAASAYAALLNLVQAGVTGAGSAGRRSFVYWQRYASELIAKFVHLYQLSDAATYRNALAIGHGEPAKLAILRASDTLLSGGGALDAGSLAAAKLAAAGLLDVNQQLVLKHPEILQHWVDWLTLAFPHLMAVHHGDIVAAVTTGTLPPTVTARVGSVRAGVVADRAIPSLSLNANESTFVANVHVMPARSVGRFTTTLRSMVGGVQIAANDFTLAHYRPGDLTIEAVTVADDRPNTRWGVLQRSHTVAWTLVRRHLMFFGGQSASVLINFMKNELAVLEGDIDTPAQNRNITFDAAGSATDLRQRLDAITAVADGYPLYEWQAALSELVESYVTLYQLSRSATYAKEENPAGHGEPTAITTLRDAEKELSSGKIDKAAYLAEHLETMADAAVKLVDAAVATSSLNPVEWRIAIEHWRTLLRGFFPTIGGDADLLDRFTAKITVAEPKKELLAGYRGPFTVRAKLLINLWENAKKEASNIPAQLERDLRSVIRLHAANFDAPDPARWIAIYTAFDLTPKTARRREAALGQVTRGPKRNKALDLPVAGDFDRLIKAVAAYFKDVADEKMALVERWITKTKRLCGGATTPMGQWAQGADFALRVAMETAVDEAVGVSIASSIENYRAWFDLIAKLPADAGVTYTTVSEALDPPAKKKKGDTT